MVRENHLGISYIIRLGLHTKQYEWLIHFFQSKAYSLEQRVRLLDKLRILRENIQGVARLSLAHIRAHFNRRHFCLLRILGIDLRLVEQQTELFVDFFGCFLRGGAKLPALQYTQLFKKSLVLLLNLKQFLVFCTENGHRFPVPFLQNSSVVHASIIPRRGRKEQGFRRFRPFIFH